MSNNLIYRANTEIRIERVLNDFYGSDLPFRETKTKTYCPLGRDHSDGGVTRTLSVYGETNTAWCFSHNMRFTPLSVWMIENEGSEWEMARSLLQHYGLRTTPKSPEDRWNELNELDMRKSMIDKAVLREMVHDYVRTKEGFESMAYNQTVLDFIGKVLQSVDKLDAYSDYDTLEEWSTKMRKVVDVFWKSIQGGN